MQKGNEVARTVHIGANIAGIGELTTLSDNAVPVLRYACLSHLFESVFYVHISQLHARQGMFLWQLQSGIPILLKVWELTKWP
jgi:hypothetical protein